MKRLKKKEGAAFTTAEVETFEHEMHIMRKAYHPNTVMLLGFCTGTGGDELMMGIEEEELYNEEKKKNKRR